jgi:hypothetical protein
MTDAPDFDDPRIPLIGAEPKVAVLRQPVQPLILSDEEGSAILKPLDDLTPVEAVKVIGMILFIVMQPQGVVPDPRTQGRTPVQVYSLWREYMVEHKLERHFELSAVRLDRPIAGRG